MKYGAVRAWTRNDLAGTDRPAERLADLSATVWGHECGLNLPARRAGVACEVFEEFGDKPIGGRFLAAAASQAQATRLRVVVEQPLRNVNVPPVGVEEPAAVGQLLSVIVVFPDQFPLDVRPIADARITARSLCAVSGVVNDKRLTNASLPQ